MAERRSRGLRRHREPNPSYYRGSARAWSPSPMAAPSRPDSYLDAEIDEIVAALREDGPLRRSELRERLRARHWGPGRFTRALLIATRRGRVRRVGRGVYEADG
jgi:uncharacterized protein YcaQ